MARRMNRTYRPAAVAAAHSRVMAAKQELLCAEEEPMHRYSHTIPPATSVTETAVPAGPSREELSTPAAMTQVLEQLSCQSQLLVDLLGAVNSLTAALLAQSGRG